MDAEHEKWRKRALDARAAVDRLCRSVSNEPEWVELNEIRQQLVLVTNRFASNHDLGVLR